METVKGTLVASRPAPSPLPVAPLAAAAASGAGGAPAPPRFVQAAGNARPGDSSSHSVASEEGGSGTTSGPAPVHWDD
jgi:hypothetical protein